MSVKRRIGAALSGFVDAFQPAWQYQQYLDRLGETEERAAKAAAAQQQSSMLTEAGHVRSMARDEAWDPDRVQGAIEDILALYPGAPLPAQETVRRRIQKGMLTYPQRGKLAAEGMGDRLLQDVSPARRGQALEEWGAQPTYAGFDPAPLLDLPLEVREGLPVTGEYQVDQYHPEAVESFKTAQQEAVSLQEAVENRDRRLAADRLMLAGQTGIVNLVLPDETAISVILKPNRDDPKAGAIIENIVPFMPGLGTSPFLTGQPDFDMSAFIPFLGDSDIDEKLRGIGALQRAPGYTQPAWTGDAPFELQFERGIGTTFPEFLGQFELPSPDAPVPTDVPEEDILGLPAEPEVVEWDPSDPNKRKIDVEVVGNKFLLPRDNPLGGIVWPWEKPEGWPVLEGLGPTPTVGIGAGIVGSPPTSPRYTPGTYPGEVLVTFDELVEFERFVIETQIAAQEVNLDNATNSFEASTAGRRPVGDPAQFKSDIAEAESHLEQLHRHLAGLPEAPAVSQTPEPIPGAGAPYSPPILSSGTLVPRPDPGSFQLPLRSFGNLVPPPTPEIGSLQLPLQSFGDLVPAPTPNVGSLQIPSDRLRSFGNLIPALQPDPGSLQLPIRSSGDLVTLPDPGSLQIPPLSVRRREASTPVSPPVTFDAERFRPVSPPGTFDQFGDSWSQFPDQPPRSEMEREPPALVEVEKMYPWMKHKNASGRGEVPLDVFEKYGQFVADASDKHKVPQELIWSIIEQETGGSIKFNPAAEGILKEHTEYGLMQIRSDPEFLKEQFDMREETPENIKFILTDPKSNIDMGTQYLKTLYKLFRFNWKLAVAAYNAGMGRVWGTDPEWYEKYPGGGTPDDRRNDPGNFTVPTGRINKDHPEGITTQYVRNVFKRSNRLGDLAPDLP